MKLCSEIVMPFSKIIFESLRISSEANLLAYIDSKFFILEFN